MFRPCLFKNIQDGKATEMCFVTRHQTNFQIKFFIFVLNFSDIRPSMVICQNNIQHVKSCKIFLCSFKLRQLVLSCQINRLKSLSDFIGSLFEFLKPFLLGPENSQNKIVGNLESDTCFRIFESDTCFRISNMQIKSSLKIFKNPSFVEKSFVLNDRNTS